jgi:hypothetical protein
MSKTCETEKCVVCGINTGVSIHQHINLRNNYVEGCGQLCMNCYGGTPVPSPVMDKVYPHTLDDATDKKYIYYSGDNSIQFGKFKFASDELRAIADAMDKAFKGQ